MVLLPQEDLLDHFLHVEAPLAEATLWVRAGALNGLELGRGQDAV